jgi:hypothetical protein
VYEYLEELDEVNWSARGNVLNQYLSNTSIGTTVKVSKQCDVLYRMTLQRSEMDSIGQIAPIRVSLTSSQPVFQSTTPGTQANIIPAKGAPNWPCIDR